MKGETKRTRRELDPDVCPVCELDINNCVESRLERAKLKAAPAPPASGQQDAREFLDKWPDIIPFPYNADYLIRMLEAYARSQVEARERELSQAIVQAEIETRGRERTEYARYVERALRGGGR